MEEIRLSIACVLVLFMGLSDLRTRTISTELWLVSISLSVIFLVHDVISWEFSHAGFMGLLAYAIAYSGVGISILISKLGLLGEGDIAPICVVGMICPLFYGFPLGFSAVFGSIICLFYYSLKSLFYNVMDMIHGECPTQYVLYYHKKREGEKFTTIPDGLRDGAKVMDDVILKENGEEKFMPVDSRGMLVAFCPPFAYFLAVCFISFGILAVLSGFLPELNHYLLVELPDSLCNQFGIEPCLFSNNMEQLDYLSQLGI